MSKNKKCCKKSLLIASICLVVAFAAALIIMAVAPYSVSAYTYKTEIGSSQITTKYYVSKEKVKVNSVTVKSDGSKSKDSDEYSAYVKDGKLYVTYTGVAYSALGEIDGYNLVISEDVVALRSVSISLSPAPPRVPVPPLWRSKWVHIPVSRGNIYSYCANFTCVLA